MVNHIVAPPLVKLLIGISQAVLHFDGMLWTVLRSECSQTKGARVLKMNRLAVYSYLTRYAYG